MSNLSLRTMDPLLENPLLENPLLEKVEQNNNKNSDH